MAMDPAIFEKKKDRKGRLAFDQGLERVEKVPKTEEQRARKLQRQERKVARFAKLLKEFDIEAEIDNYLSGRQRGEWSKRIVDALGIPPLIEKALKLNLIEEPEVPAEDALSSSASRVSRIVSDGDEDEVRPRDGQIWGSDHIADKIANSILDKRAAGIPSSQSEHTPSLGPTEKGDGDDQGQSDALSIQNDEGAHQHSPEDTVAAPTAHVSAATEPELEASQTGQDDNRADLTDLEPGEAPQDAGGAPQGSPPQEAEASPREEANRQPAVDDFSAVFLSPQNQKALQNIQEKRCNVDRELKRMTIVLCKDDQGNDKYYAFLASSVYDQS